MNVNQLDDRIWRNEDLKDGDGAVARQVDPFEIDEQDRFWSSCLLNRLDELLDRLDRVNNGK